MKVLLDTHAFIWWDSEPEKLSASALAVCQDPANALMLSVVSAWEMQIKSQLSKIELHVPLVELIENQRQANGIEVLPVELEHVLALDELPSHHKDPFDRLLVAQAVVEGAVLLSHDATLRKYPAELHW